MICEILTAFLEQGGLEEKGHTGVSTREDSEIFRLVTWKLH